MKNSFNLLLLLLTISQARSQLISSGLTEAQKLTLLDKHNQLRQQIASGSYTGQPSASNMLYMKWDTALAASAQRWANKMKFEHSPSNGKYGENSHLTISRYSISYNPAAIVQSWFDEVKSYNWKTIYISNFVISNNYGHYTQIVWAKTNLLGCGFVSFSSGGQIQNITICQYKQIGNMPGQPVYQKGIPCSQCGSLSCNPSYKALCGV